MHLPELWTRCFYTMTKYTVSPNKPKRKYILTCLAFAYGHRLLLWSYCRYHHFKLDWISSYIKFDPFVYFTGITMAHLYDSFVPIMIYLFSVFNFVCQHKLYWLEVVAKPTWTFWNQLVVQMQDRYHESTLRSDRVDQIWKARQSKLMHRLATSKLSSTICPTICQRAYCKVRAKAEMLFHLDHVDKQRLFARSLSALPFVSARVQSRVLLALILLDGFGFIAQLVIGMRF